MLGLRQEGGDDSVDEWIPILFLLAIGLLSLLPGLRWALVRQTYAVAHGLRSPGDDENVGPPDGKFQAGRHQDTKER